MWQDLIQLNELGGCVQCEIWTMLGAQLDPSWTTGLNQSLGDGNSLANSSPLLVEMVPGGALYCPRCLPGYGSTPM